MALDNSVPIYYPTAIAVSFSSYMVKSTCYFLTEWTLRSCYRDLALHHLLQYHSGAAALLVTRTRSCFSYRRSLYCVGTAVTETTTLNWNVPNMDTESQMVTVTRDHVTDYQKSDWRLCCQAACSSRSVDGLFHRFCAFVVYQMSGWWCWNQQ